MAPVTGLDLGKTNDWTAIVTLDDGTVTRLERFRQVPYPEVARHVASTVRGRLLVDGTGVGVAVVDELRQLRVPLLAVTLTAGQQATRTGPGSVSVPKPALLGALARLIGSRRLRVPRDLPLRDVLLDELLRFHRKIDSRTGHERLEARRGHDDVVLALALAAWGESLP